MAAITNQDIYELIDSKFTAFETKYDRRLELMQNQINTKTDFRNQMVGKMTVIFAVIGVGINWLWDLFTRRAT